MKHRRIVSPSRTAAHNSESHSLGGTIFFSYLLLQMYHRLSRSLSIVRNAAAIGKASFSVQGVVGVHQWSFPNSWWLFEKQTGHWHQITRNQSRHWHQIARNVTFAYCVGCSILFRFDDKRMSFSFLCLGMIRLVLKKVMVGRWLNKIIPQRVEEKGGYFFTTK